MILWLFGNTGAGKTTLAASLREELGAVMLDGDELRTVWKLGFSKADRREQNLRAARLAQLIARQGLPVIVATICPYDELRRSISRMCNPVWVYLPGGAAPSAERPFEPPTHRCLALAPASPAVWKRRVLAHIRATRPDRAPARLTPDAARTMTHVPSE